MSCVVGNPLNGFPKTQQKTSNKHWAEASNVGEIIVNWRCVHVNANLCSFLGRSIPAALAHCRRERAELPQPDSGPMSTRHFGP
eukprot:CAMPEP_0177527164 /NCGR_PEP_ID=MMETSP0369-20130122/51476_1 /TAXON_ID=447022 ORGANISM="Scrippsiella hangoei-like, Strain SHHI-4" /NCGR_SAMPLE_ID=MMETSP0369 /ASSEMBLY_ACC=CAM_ASM_000364 /LENGTH=83 /DNA_ID=CAMNT_0019007447 /DNA_START=155 /DNA_END=403 /DNA_ORIENTATION=-